MALKMEQNISFTKLLSGQKKNSGFLASPWLYLLEVLEDVAEYPGQRDLPHLAELGPGNRESNILREKNGCGTLSETFAIVKKSLLV